MNFRPRHIREEDFKKMQRVRSGVVGTRPESHKKLHRAKYMGQAPRGCAEPPMGKAGSNPASSPYKPYASKWELQYSKVLQVEKRVRRNWNRLVREHYRIQLPVVRKQGHKSVRKPKIV